ncbi:PREDICTED: uncharacterized protein LOC104387519 [Chaetura pelagica]|uniref:uncharacterized protein LOC104387519 n=1 Tax=Chaetura pelagica TaxID=8897 RepID=UPI0005231C75|nr:PREDICTED: uncharacterized protein LOC104387519 [Chaetura pelagica]
MLAPRKAAVLGLKFQHGRGCSQSSLQKLGMISNHRHLHLTRAPIHQQTRRIDAALTYRVLVPNLQQVSFLSRQEESPPADCPPMHPAVCFAEQASLFSEFEKQRYKGSCGS